MNSQWNDEEEEKWIFDQQDNDRDVESGLKYIKYLTLFFVIFSGLMYFIATKFF